MAKGSKGEYILYPCYFNTVLSREEGRRVPRWARVKSPVLGDIERALKHLNLKFRVEDHSHPAYWGRREGRVVVQWQDKKEALIKKVAHKLEMKK